MRRRSVSSFRISKRTANSSSSLESPLTAAARDATRQLGPLDVLANCAILLAILLAFRAIAFVNLCRGVPKVY